jgi:hypothetical protein
MLSLYHTLLTVSQDYHMTSYVGEFINTLTSLFYSECQASTYVPGPQQADRKQHISASAV